MCCNYFIELVFLMLGTLLIAVQKVDSIIQLTRSFYNDECISAPCLNGATCSDRVNGYSCKCTAGFEGDSCDTGQYLCCYLSHIAFNFLSVLPVFVHKVVHGDLTRISHF